MVKHVVRTIKASKKLLSYDPVLPQPELEPVFGDFYRSPYVERTPSYDETIIFKPPIANIDMVLDKCYIGIQLTVSSSFGNLSPVQIAYRHPNCRPVQPIVTTYPDLSGCGGYGFQIASCYELVGLDINEQRVFNPITVKEFITFYRQKYPDVTSSDHQILIQGGGSGSRRNFEEGYANESIGVSFLRNSSGFPVYSCELWTVHIYFGTSITDTKAFFNKLALVLNFFRNPNFEIVKVFDNPGTSVCGLAPPPILPPPLPPPMSCCPNVQQNDELLRLILKKIGSSDLPATVPTLLTNREKGTTTIENLAQFNSYTIKQLDAVCGKYPIEVKIKDSNLLKEGEQPKTIKIPNLAEGIAELLGLLLCLKTESSATLSAAIRGLIEAGSAKQSAILAYDYAKANSEFLGYKGKQVQRKVPFAFNFKEQQLDKMLREGEFEIKGFENDDKDDFKDIIMPILNMAAMYRAANFRKVDANDPISSIKTILEGYNAFANLTKENIDDPKSKKDEEEKHKNPENWDQFINSAEIGFIEQPGIKNNTEPYDRPFDQRPKIREIGNDTSDFED